MLSSFHICLCVLPAHWLLGYTTFSQNIVSSLKRTVVLCVNHMTLKGLKMEIFGLKKKKMCKDMFYERSWGTGRKDLFVANVFS